MKNGAVKLLDSAYIQSGIFTLAFVFILYYPLFLGITDWYNVIDIFIFGVPCYLSSFIFAILGKKLIKTRFIGGYIGSLAGMVFYGISLVSVYYLLARIST